MSQIIDEKIVAMKFDNAQFEKNIQTSMSTLDKLKAKLNFKDASKGVEEVNSAVNNFSFANMEKSLEALNSRFSTTGIVGMRVIQNLTDSAMKFAAQVNSFTLGAIKNGGIRRAMNLENANFQLQGLLKDGNAVAAVMQNVSDAVDGTAYSLDAAASVASQLAASGMKAGDSMFSSLRAVAGVAAMTNSSYEDIGRIFTQVAGQGRLMGDQLLQLSGRGMNAAATLAQYLHKSEAEVRTMTSKGQISFQTFANAMDSAFGEHAKKANETFNGSISNVKASLARIGAEFVSPLIVANGPLVKFFNAIREKINDIKEIIIPVAGDVTDFISKVIYKIAKVINKLDIKGFVNKIKDPFSDLAKRVDAVTAPTRKATKSMKDFGQVVNKVINGDFGNGQKRFKALTKAGYDWAYVQNLVNKKLGDSTRHATKYKASQDSVNKSQDITIKKLSEMSDAQLKSVGFTKSEIKAFHELEDQSKKTGISMEDLLKDTSKLGSKSLILDSLSNIGKSLVKVFKAVKDAADDAFELFDVTKISDAISAFHKLSQGLVMSDKTVDELTRTFRGLFSIIALASKIAKAGLTVTFKIISAILKGFHLDILTVTATLGDFVTSINKAISNNKLFTTVLGVISKTARMEADELNKFKNAIADIPQVKAFVEQLKKIDLSEMLSKVLNNLKSSKFVKIGKNIIAGLRKGVTSESKKIITQLAKLGLQMLEAIKSVLGIHSPSIEMFEVGKNAILGLINGIKNGINNVLSTLSDVGWRIIEWGKGLDWEKIFAIGKLLLTLKAAKTITKYMDAIVAPAEGLGKMFSSVAGFIKKATEQIDIAMKSFKKVCNAKAFNIRADGIEKLAKSIAILAGAVFLISKIDPDRLVNSVLVIGILAGTLATLAYAINQLSQSSVQIDKTGIKLTGVRTTLLAIGGCLLMMAATAKIMGKMSWNQLKKGFISLTGMIALMVIVLGAYGQLVKGKSAQNIDKAAKMISKIGRTLLLLAIVAKIVGTLSPDAMTKGALFLGGFATFMIALIAATRFAGKKVDEAGNLALKVVAAMAIMVKVCQLVNKLTPDELKKGALFAHAFIIFIRELVNATMICKGTEIAQIGGLLLSISISIVLMIRVCQLAAKLKPNEVAKGVIFAGAMVAFIRGLLEVTKVSSEQQMGKVAATIISTAIALAIMAGICITLGSIDLATLAKGELAVAGLAKIMEGLIKATEKASECKGSIMAMAVAIGVMAASLVALSFIKPDKLAGATLALSAVMAMFAVVEKCSKDVTTAMKSLVVLTVAIGMIGLVLNTVGQLPAEQSLAAALSLSAVLLAMAAALKILSTVKEVSTDAYVAMAVLTVVVGALAGILYLVSGMNAEAALPIATALSALILAMSGACVLLGVVGLMGPAAIAGTAALIALVTKLGIFIGAIGALVDKFPQLEQFLDTGIPIIEKIGKALGSFFGNIVGGFLTGVTSNLTEIADDLSAFMVHLAPFIAGAKLITEDSMAGVKTLAEALLLLTSSNLLDQISKFIFGSSSLQGFADQLTPLADGLVEFSKKVSGGNINVDAIKSSATAIKAIAEVSKSLPKEGGLLGAIFGDIDVGKFGTQLSAFGAGLKAYGDAVVDLQTKAIEASKNPAKDLIEIAKSVDNSDGVVQWWVGQKDIGKFGGQLAKFGKGLKAYGNEVADADIKAINASRKGAIALAGISTTIAQNGGALNQLATSGELGGLSTALVTFAKAMNNYAKEINTDVSEKISKSTEAARNLANLMRNISHTDVSGVGNFVKAVNKLAKANISGMADNISGTDVSGIADKGKELSSALAKGFSGNNKSINSAASSTTRSMSKTISDKSGSFKTAGSNLMKALIKGLASKNKTATSQVRTICANMSAAIGNKYSSFEQNGKYLGEGLIIGIEAKYDEAYNAGYKLGQKAAQGEKDGQKSASPSKLTIQAGKWLGEGLIIGMDRMNKKVYKSGKNMGETATESLSSAMTAATRLLTADMSMTPTIRPVVDLSSVNAGANAINGMFGSGVSLGISGNLTAINRMMGSRQNGNADVISAIRELGKSMGNVGNTTYNVNGITYDDGSNISNAVQTLVRAATVERRK